MDRYFPRWLLLMAFLTIAVGKLLKLGFMVLFYLLLLLVIVVIVSRIGKRGK